MVVPWADYLDYHSILIVGSKKIKVLLNKLTTHLLD